LSFARGASTPEDDKKQNAGMALDADACYRAFKARDPRFDGRFFVAVRSTRVYCRPICTVKIPKRENCRFYSSAAAAEADGYRPCLRCRPELAPGSASVDAGGRLARAAAFAIEGGALDDCSLQDLAVKLGTTDRHLRRTFKTQFGASPVAYAQTQRLLLAKRLLADTELSVTDVAFASGFRSLRRFNALFKERYHLNPMQLRNRTQELAVNSPLDVISFEMAFRPPYDWRACVEFLASRAIPGVEDVSSETYRRSVRVERGTKTYTGWIVVTPLSCKAALNVQISGSLLGAVAPALARIKQAMDLTADPEEIGAVLGPLAARNPGLRVPGAFDGFEVAVRAILGQHISVKAASALAGRFAAAFGCPIDTPFATVSYLFPRAIDVVELDVKRIAALGILASTARSILALANAIVRGDLSIGPAANVENMLERLRRLPGVDEWTAQYVAMRAMAWPDAFPNDELCLGRAEAWRPWRAYAAMHLWQVSIVPIW
jgi:AraC family transcriptional regulator of adaptative response / DNA-3-methyladenine glycosylase II